MIGFFQFSQKKTSPLKHDFGKKWPTPKTHSNFAPAILGKSWGKPPPIFRCKTAVTFTLARSRSAAW